MSRYTTIPVIIMLSLTPVMAQQVVTAGGSAQVRLEDHMSKEEAREKARQLAMINAIESVFGAYVERDSDIDIEDGKTSFRIIGKTRVRGDWLKTVEVKYGEDQLKIRGRGRKEKETWITCRITGKVREIGLPETALEFTPLNCPDLVCRTYDFNDGEPFYLSFRTPVNGFLSIFIRDGSGTVYRLLPYGHMPEAYINHVPVNADFPYLFFMNHPDHDYFPGFSYMMVDEILMSAEETREFLDLYIVFSTADYTKPLLGTGEGDNSGVPLPPSVHPDEFTEWLDNNRIHDPSFQYKRITLTINR